MTGQPEILVHVGAHKTGTSLIQNSLADNRAALRAADVAYVHKYELGETALYVHLQQVIGKASGPPVGREEARAALLEMIPSHAARLLLSHENLLGATGLTSSKRTRRLYPDAGTLIQELAAVCDDLPVSVIVTIRNQPDFVESMYLQAVMTGRDRTFRQHRSKIACDRLGWDLVLDEIEAVVGHEHLIVIPFERIYKAGAGGFVRYFLECGGLPIPEPLAVSERQNRSFSDKALRVALRAYPLLEVAERRRLSSFLRKHFDDATNPRPRLFSGRQRYRILRDLRTSNAAVFQRHVRGSSAKVRAYYEPQAVRLRDEAEWGSIRRKGRKAWRHVANKLSGRE